RATANPQVGVRPLLEGSGCHGLLEKRAAPPPARPPRPNRSTSVPRCATFWRVSWVETPSASFTARHDAGDADDAVALLDRLELFRTTLDRRFFRTPGDVAIVMHPTPLELSMA